MPRRLIKVQRCRDRPMLWTSAVGWRPTLTKLIMQSSQPLLLSRVRSSCAAPAVLQDHEYRPVKQPQPDCTDRRALTEAGPRSCRAINTTQPAQPASARGRSRRCACNQRAISVKTACPVPKSVAGSAAIDATTAELPVPMIAVCRTP
jgi:hypothetical protein